MDYKECEQCPGYCCMYNDAICTPLTLVDIQRISKHLKIQIENFVKMFVSVTRGVCKYEGVPNAMGHFKTHYRACPFLRQGLCGIHSVKPKACSEAKPYPLGDIPCAEWHKVHLGWLPCY